MTYTTRTPRALDFSTSGLLDLPLSQRVFVGEKADGVFSPALGLPDVSPSATSRLPNSRTANLSLFSAPRLLTSLLLFLLGLFAAVALPFQTLSADGAPTFDDIMLAVFNDSFAGGTCPRLNQLSALQTACTKRCARDTNGDPSSSINCSSCTQTPVSLFYNKFFSGCTKDKPNNCPWHDPTWTAKDALDLKGYTDFFSDLYQCYAGNSNTDPSKGGFAGFYHTGVGDALLTSNGSTTTIKVSDLLGTTEGKVIYSYILTQSLITDINGGSESNPSGLIGYLQDNTLPINSLESTEKSIGVRTFLNAYNDLKSDQSFWSENPPNAPETTLLSGLVTLFKNLDTIGQTSVVGAKTDVPDKMISYTPYFAAIQQDVIKAQKALDVALTPDNPLGIANFLGNVTDQSLFSISNNNYLSPSDLFTVLQTAAQEYRTTKETLITELSARLPVLTKFYQSIKDNTPLQTVLAKVGVSIDLSNDITALKGISDDLGTNPDASKLASKLAFATLQGYLTTMETEEQKRVTFFQNVFKNAFSSIPGISGAQAIINLQDIKADLSKETRSIEDIDTVITSAIQALADSKRTGAICANLAPSLGGLTDLLFPADSSSTYNNLSKQLVTKLQTALNVKVVDRDFLTNIETTETCPQTIDPTTIDTTNQMAVLSSLVPIASNSSLVATITGAVKDFITKNDPKNDPSDLPSQLTTLFDSSGDFWKAFLAEKPNSSSIKDQLTKLSATVTSLSSIDGIDQKTLADFVNWLKGNSLPTQLSDLQTQFQALLTDLQTAIGTTSGAGILKNLDALNTQWTGVEPALASYLKTNAALTRAAGDFTTAYTTTLPGSDSIKTTFGGLANFKLVPSTIAPANFFEAIWTYLNPATTGGKPALQDALAQIGSTASAGLALKNALLTELTATDMKRYTALPTAQDIAAKFCAPANTATAPYCSSGLFTAGFDTSISGDIATEQDNVDPKKNPLFSSLKTLAVGTLLNDITILWTDSTKLFTNLQGVVPAAQGDPPTPLTFLSVVNPYVSPSVKQSDLYNIYNNEKAIPALQTLYLALLGNSKPTATAATDIDAKTLSAVTPAGVLTSLASASPAFADLGSPLFADFYTIIIQAVQAYTTKNSGAQAVDQALDAIVSPDPKTLGSMDTLLSTLGYTKAYLGNLTAATPAKPADILQAFYGIDLDNVITFISGIEALGSPTKSNATLSYFVIKQLAPIFNLPSTYLTDIETKCKSSDPQQRDPACHEAFYDFFHVIASLSNPQDSTKKNLFSSTSTANDGIISLSLPDLSKPTSDLCGGLRYSLLYSILSTAKTEVGNPSPNLDAATATEIRDAAFTGCNTDTGTGKSFAVLATLSTAPTPSLCVDSSIKTGSEDTTSASAAIKSLFSPADTTVDCKTVKGNFFKADGTLIDPYTVITNAMSASEHLSTWGDTSSTLGGSNLGGSNDDGTKTTIFGTLAKLKGDLDKLATAINNLPSAIQSALQGDSDLKTLFTNGRITQLDTLYTALKTEADKLLAALQGNDSGAYCKSLGDDASKPDQLTACQNDIKSKLSAIQQAIAALDTSIGKITDAVTNTVEKDTDPSKAVTDLKSAITGENINQEIQTIANDFNDFVKNDSDLSSLNISPDQISRWQLPSALGGTATPPTPGGATPCGFVCAPTAGTPVKHYFFGLLMYKAITDQISKTAATGCDKTALEAAQSGAVNYIINAIQNDSDIKHTQDGCQPPAFDGTDPDKKLTFFSECKMPSGVSLDLSTIKRTDIPSPFQANDQAAMESAVTVILSTQCTMACPPGNCTLLDPNQALKQQCQFRYQGGSFTDKSGVAQDLSTLVQGLQGNFENECFTQDANKGSQCATRDNINQDCKACGSGFLRCGTTNTQCADPSKAPSGFTFCPTTGTPTSCVQGNTCPTLSTPAPGTSTSCQCGTLDENCVLTGTNSTPADYNKDRHEAERTEARNTVYGTLSIADLCKPDWQGIQPTDDQVRAAIQKKANLVLSEMQYVADQAKDPTTFSCQGNNKSYGSYLTKSCQRYCSLVNNFKGCSSTSDPNIIDKECVNAVNEKAKENGDIDINTGQGAGCCLGEGFGGSCTTKVTCKSFLIATGANSIDDVIRGTARQVSWDGPGKGGCGYVNSVIQKLGVDASSACAQDIKKINGCQ